MIHDNTEAVSASRVHSRNLVLLRVAGVVGFALLTAVGANIAIPLPHTPVPMTLQTLFVLLAGLTLGPRLGLVSMAFYLLLGSVGYHVFALGSWGLPSLIGSTGGYLLGFVLAQPIIGVLSRPRTGGHSPSYGRLLVAILAGHAVIFACGLIWLAAWLHIGVTETLLLGLVPFIPGGVIKAVLAFGVGHAVVKRVRPLMNA